MNIQLQSTTSEPTNVTIAAPGILWSLNLMLESYQILSIDAPDEVEADRTEEFQNGTIVIISDRDIYVTAVSFVTSSLGTFPVVPFQQASGYEFFVAQYPPSSTLYPSEIMITSGPSETSIKVKKPTDVSFNGLIFPDNFQNFEISNDEIGFVLQANSSLQIRHATIDFTGWQFISTYPVSIIAGVECAYITFVDLNCDHIAAYMPPVDQLGKQFILAPFAGRDSGYIFRIVAVRDETMVTITSMANIKMNTSNYYEGTVEERVVTTINSNKPILVVQFAKGFASDNNDGDPFMIAVPPREQYVNAISFASFDMNSYDINKNYLNLIITCDLLDGIIFNEESFENKDWLDVLMEEDQCVARREILTSRTYYITHELPSAKFIAFLYGSGSNISYGHALDHSFTQQTCTVQDEVNKTKEADCDFKESK